MSVVFQNQNLDNFSNLHYEDILGCVSRLTDVPVGDVWKFDQIMERRETLLGEGREWIAVDNLPLHEEIKRGEPGWKTYVENYKESLYNLSKSGIQLVCYNFTPLYYKLRTHFNEGFGDKYAFSFFDPVAFSVFDIFILKRSFAEQTYNGYQRHKAKVLFQRLSETQLATLTSNVFEGLHSVKSGSLTDLKRQLIKYTGMSNDEFSDNLRRFDSEIMPVANDLKIRLKFKADNPCRNLFGLPYIVNSCRR